MRRIFWRIALYTSVLLVTTIILAPVCWMFIMSVSSMTDLTARPMQWLPATMDFSRYRMLLTFEPNSPGEIFLLALRNTFLAAAGASILSLIVGFPAAYSFSRLPGRRAPLLYLVLSTYMLPSVALILPIYIALSAFGLLNTPFSLAVVYCSIVLPFVVWLLTGNLNTLPREIDQAAAMDGANLWQTIRHVVLPLSGAAIGTAALFGLLLAWDEFFFSLILTNDLRAKTLSVAIADFAAGRATDYPLIATAGLLSALPPVFIAFFLQRSLVKGLAAGSVKG
jgi:multiple sugar transport system permease protein